MPVAALALFTLFFLHRPIIRFIIPHFLVALVAAAAPAPAAVAAAFFFLNIQLNIPGFLGPFAVEGLGADGAEFKNEGFFLIPFPNCVGGGVLVEVDAFAVKNEGFFLIPFPNRVGGGVLVEVDAFAVKNEGFFLNPFPNCVGEGVLVEVDAFAVKTEGFFVLPFPNCVELLFLLDELNVGLNFNLFGKLRVVVPVFLLVLNVKPFLLPERFTELFPLLRFPFPLFLLPKLLRFPFPLLRFPFPLFLLPKLLRFPFPLFLLPKLLLLFSVLLNAELVLKFLRFTAVLFTAVLFTAVLFTAVSFLMRRFVTSFTGSRIFMYLRRLPIASTNCFLVICSIWDVSPTLRAIRLRSVRFVAESNKSS